MTYGYKNDIIGKVLLQPRCWGHLLIFLYVSVPLLSVSVQTYNH